LEDDEVINLGRQFTNIKLMNFKGILTLCPVIPFLEIYSKKILDAKI
jgi:hypothetical protein